MSTDAPAWPAGHGRLVLDEVDSTNAEALRRAGTLTGPCWILARRQVAGRGRHGRPWCDPDGNFAATLLMQPAEAAGVAALRSFVAALALADALRAVAAASGARITLKWPNDVLLNDGKVAGILLEGSGDGALLRHLAIGIGVNLSAVPSPDVIGPGPFPPVSILSKAGVVITPEQFLDHLAPAYACRERAFAAQGFGPIRAAWLAHAARLGQDITARTGRAVTRGRFRDIGMDGALILETGHGAAKLAAAEIYF